MNLKIFSCPSEFSKNSIAAKGIYLHTDADVLQNLIDYGDAEFGMILLEIIHQCSDKWDVAKLDLPNLGERVQDVLVDLAEASSGSS